MPDAADNPGTAGVPPATAPVRSGVPGERLTRITRGRDGRGPRNSRTNWIREQQLLALRLYLRTPFGRLHRTNPDILALARLLNRTPSAIAMKACNFANLDPSIHQKGLSGASEADKLLWNDFMANPTAITLEMEDAAARLGTPDADTDLPLPPVLTADETETQRLVRVRRVQSMFRESVLISYDGRCAVTGLAVPEVLVASHIIPWKDSVARRADPTNGILLNALLDRAFDRGLISFDDQLRVLVSGRLKEAASSAALACSLREIEGRPLTLPKRFAPDPAAVNWHRERLFKG
jgi:putative restriction endonuclease